MKKKALIITAVAVVVLLLCGGLAYLYVSLQDQKKNNANLEELAAMDKKEMENEYTQFALQYDELKKSIKDDSLMTRLSEEQNHTQQLLAELKRTKSTDAVTISRLKKELETVRAVLRSYIMQVDSLQRLNQTLVNENQQVKQRYTEATSQISNLTSEKQNLSEKVAIAAQLDATGVSVSPQNKRGKKAKKTKDVTRFVVSFTVTKNITAKTGPRTIYVRLTKPNSDVVGQSGSFSYENKQLEYSAVKTIEYTGDEQLVTLYIPVSEFLSPGTFNVYLFADGTMIGSRNFSIEK
ncbi:MAG: hypothetical protein RR386_02605 [Bacteroidaceae bacterium]